MTVVTMSSTEGELTSGQTYIVRAKEYERLLAAGHATKASTRGPAANVPPSKTGKSSK